MSIIRAARPQSNFYILDKRISEDKSLSWMARGLLIFLLGKPDHWQISVDHLRKETETSRKPTGRDGIYAMLEELIAEGYIKRTQARSQDGKMAGYDYIVYDEPITLGAVEDEFDPFPEKPDTAEPFTANPTLVSIDVEQGLKKNKPLSGKPDDSEQTFAQFWHLYPNKVAKAAALKAWKKIKPDASLLARILNALAAAKDSDGWKKDGGRFVPHPATWLNGQRWEDESPAAQSGNDEVLDRNAKAPPSWFKVPEGARWVQGLGVAW